MAGGPDSPAFPHALEVNGKTSTLAIAAGDTLLEVLRGRLGLTGAKAACGRGECGACTVLLGGRPVMACVTLALAVAQPVETIEGVAEEARDLRAALADCGGFQCAFCTPGMVVRGAALLRRGLPRGDAELRRAMAGNLCRCTGYQGIVEALRRVAGARHAADDGG